MNRAHTNVSTATAAAIQLPPGQLAIEHFPRFGTHLNRPAPQVPADPTIEITGPLAQPRTIRVADLASMPRRDLHADFHCVSGWTATGLYWEGVPFATLYRTVIEPDLVPGADITHIVFTGLDGHESALLIEDALGENVLLADRLNGAPLDSDHGAPVRLFSPDQYGYMSTKHLVRIELRTSPPRRLGAAHPVAAIGLRGPFVMRHPRARVRHEERHPFVPGRMLRALYHPIIRPGARASADRPRPRLPDDEHYARPWRIHDITNDFRLEDVWELPGEIEPDRFRSVVERILAFDLADTSSGAVRLLVAARSRLGELLRLDRPGTGVGERVASIRERLPADLRDLAPAARWPTRPAALVFLTDDEAAIEIANATVHAVIHLARIRDGAGRFRIRLAVLVKPNGALGNAYLAVIRPLRHLIVYPSLLPALAARINGVQ